MSFTVTQKVLFRHCDPAGIVFYPRYFEMIVDCVETFFDEALGVPFETLHKTGAAPTARVNTEFSAPSHHGDILQLELRCERLGSSGLDLQIIARSGGELRFRAEVTHVYVDAAGKPQQWPPELRAALEQHVKRGV